MSKYNGRYGPTITRSVIPLVFECTGRWSSNTTKYVDFIAKLNTRGSPGEDSGAELKLFLRKRLSCIMMRSISCLARFFRSYIPINNQETVSN